MAAKTALDIIGVGGEGKYPAADGSRSFKSPPIAKMSNYDLFVNKAAQAEGIIVHMWVPKGEVAAADTIAITFAAA